MDRRYNGIVFVELGWHELLRSSFQADPSSVRSEIVPANDIRRRSAAIARYPPPVISASSYSRCKCGSYQVRSGSNSAGQFSVLRKRAISLTKAGQSSAACFRHRKPLEHVNDLPFGCNFVQDFGCRAWPDAWQELQNPKASHSIPRIFAPAQHAHHVFDVRCFEKFEPAIFDKRDVAAGKLDFELGAVMDARNSTACSFKGTPASRALKFAVPHSAPALLRRRPWSGMAFAPTAARKTGFS